MANITINFFEGTHPGGEPQIAAEQAPRTGKPTLSSVDAVVRCPSTNTLVTARMSSAADADPVMLRATVSDLTVGANATLPIPATIYLPRSVISQVRQEEISPSETALLDLNGRQVQQRVRRLAVIQPPGTNVEIQFGVFVDGTDPAPAAPIESEFVIVTDPEPLIIVSLLCAASCIAMIGIQKLTNQCNEQVRAAITACSENGGRPKINLDAYFGLNWNPFKFGCGTHCRVDCEPAQSR